MSLGVGDAMTLPRSPAARLEALFDLYAPMDEDGKRHPEHGLIDDAELLAALDLPILGTSDEPIEFSARNAAQYAINPRLPTMTKDITVTDESYVSTWVKPEPWTWDWSCDGIFRSRMLSVSCGTDRPMLDVWQGATKDEVRPVVDFLLQTPAMARLLLWTLHQAEQDYHVPCNVCGNRIDPDLNEVAPGDRAAAIRAEHVRVAPECPLLTVLRAAGVIDGT